MKLLKGVKSVGRAYIWGAICGLVCFVGIPLLYEIIRILGHVLGLKHQTFYCGFTDAYQCSVESYISSSLSFGLFLGAFFGIIVGIVIFGNIILGCMMVVGSIRRIRKTPDNQIEKIVDVPGQKHSFFKKFTSCLEICVGLFILLGFLWIFVSPSLKYIVAIRSNNSFLFSHEWGKPDFSISTIDVIKNAPGPMDVLNEKTSESYIIEWATKIKEYALTHPEDKKYCVEQLTKALETAKDRFTYSNSGFLNQTLHPEKDAIARSMIIKFLGEIGDDSAVPYLMKEVSSPEKTIVESACPQNLLEQNCERSSFDNAVKALLKLGKKLEDLPVNWKEQFSKKPAETIGTLYDVLLPNGQSLEEVENLKIDDDKIVRGALDALQTCKGCTFLVAPFLTHAKDSEKLIPGIRNTLNTSKLLSHDRVGESLHRGIDNRRYVLEKAIEKIEKKQSICYSDELYILSQCYSRGFGYSCSIGFGPSRKTDRSESALMDIIKSDANDSCVVFGMKDGFLMENRSGL